VKLFWEVIQGSAKTNIQQLEQRHMFEDIGGVPRPLYNEIEAAFLAASRDSALINALGAKLQRHGLFERYQDRFFALLKMSNK
jgi:hypothetical protein